MAFPTRIPYAEALEILTGIGRQRRGAPERLAIQRADGRILAQAVRAEFSLPPFDNSRVDGFADARARISRSTFLWLHFGEL